MDVKKTYLGFEEVVDMSPDVYFSQNYDKLFLIIAPSCSNEKRKGSYRIMLKCRDKKKLVADNLTNVSDAGECALIGLREALKMITGTNYEVNVVTGIGLGFQGTVNKGKSSHKDLVYEILNELNSKKLVLKEIIFKGNSNAVKNIIDESYPLSKQKSNSPKEKAIDLQSYSVALSEQVKQETIKNIILNMHSLRFNDETIARVCMQDVAVVKDLINKERK